MQPRSDPAGVISLIFGVLALVFLLLACPTCGFLAYLAVPVAAVGALVGVFGRGNLRVAGLTLNLLVLVPALILVAIFLAGSLGSFR
jgi:hypothetical protein